MANAITYIKNVGKSIGYASIDVFKEKNPVFADFAETNGELMNDMYKSVKDLKKTIKGLPNKIMESQYGEFGKTYLENILDDLKTGKFYNKEREDQYTSSAAAGQMEGLDFDVLDDFGDGGGDDLDLGNLDSLGEDEEISSNEMMDIVGEKSSRAISTAVARSSEYIVQATTQATKASYNQMNAIYGGIHTGMSTINQNISKLLEFSNENMNLHFENSKTFYEQMTNTAQEQTQYLKEISETLKAMNQPATAEKSKDKNRYSDLVSFEGNIDIENYLGYIKKNLVQNTPLSDLSSLMEMAEGAGGLKQFAASPLQFLAKGLVESVIPKTLDKSMESLNKTLSGVVANTLFTIRKNASDFDKGGIWSILDDIFGISTQRKTSLDPSQYEKGKVPFDGITRKSIIEVIPTYLSKILSALTGQKRDTFDYDSGKFVTLEKLQKDIDDMTTSGARSASHEMRSLYKKKRDDLDLSTEDLKKFDKFFEDAMLELYTEQKKFETRDKKFKFNNVEDEDGKFTRMLQEMFDGTSENMALMDRILRQTNTQTRNMESKQNSASITSLFNNSTTEEGKEINSLSSLFGNVNNVIVEKLTEIRKELAYIRIHGIGSTGKRYKRKGAPISKAPDFNAFQVPEVPKETQKESVTKSNKKDTSPTTEDDAPESEEESYDKTEKSEAEQLREQWEKYDMYTNTPQKYKRIYGDKIPKKPNVSRSKVKQMIEKEKREKDKETKKEGRKLSISERIANIKQTATGIVQGPMNIASDLMDKADKRIYELFYGPVGGKEEDEFDDDRSFKEVFFDKIENGLDKIQEKLLTFSPEEFKENAHDAAEKFLKYFGIDLDKTTEGIRKFLFGIDEDGNPTKGGIFGKFVNDFKESFKSIGNWVKSGFKDTGDWAGVTKKKEKSETSSSSKPSSTPSPSLDLSGVKDAVLGKHKAETEPVVEGNAARGLRRVKKAGTYILGPDEFVVPNSMDAADVAYREREEEAVRSNIIDDIKNMTSYKKGRNKKGNQFKKSDYEATKKKDRKGKRQKRKGVMSEEAAQIIEEQLEENKEETTTTTTNDEEKSFGGKIIDEVVNAKDALVDGLNRVKEFIGGSEEDVDKFKENASSFLSDILDNSGTLAAGATVGAGVSLLTGMIGGPLVGAAAGAAVALTTKSKFVQDMLFGNEEEGKDGVLPKNITNAIKKYLPDMGKGGAMGGIAGLLLGNPIAGIMVGSAIGFAKNNEKVQGLLIGDGKMFANKEEFQKKVRKVLPKMGAGAIAGLVAGPFGSIATNILVGSALGFASDTDRFKDLIFGEVVDEKTGKREGGIFDAVAKPMTNFFKDLTAEFKEYIQKDILRPVKDAIMPMKKQFELMAKGIGDFIGNIFKNSVVIPLEKSLQKFIIGPLGKLFGGLFKPVKGAAKWLLSRPSAMIGNIGNRLRRQHIKTGNADYMSAEERIAFRESNGMKGMFTDLKKDRYHRLDKSMVNQSDDVLSAAEAALSGIADAHKTTDQLRQGSLKNISKSLRSDSIDYDTSRAIKTMIENGRYKDAIKFVQKAKIENPKVKADLLKTIKRESARINTSYDMKKDSKKTINNLGRTLKEMGLDLDEDSIKKLSKNDKEAQKLLSMIRGEIKYRKNHQEDKSEETQEKKTESFQDDVKTDMDRIIQLLEKLNGKEVTDEKGNKTKVGGQTNIDSKQNQDRVKNLETEYDSEKLRGESVFERAANRVRNKGAFRAGLGNLKDTALFAPKLGVKAVKGVGKVSMGTVKLIANEALAANDAIRDSKLVDKIAGDRHVDWRKPGEKQEVKTHESKILKTIASILTFQAAKDGIDPTTIDDKNEDPKKVAVKAKRKLFSKKKRTSTKVIDGHIFKVRQDSNGDEEIDPTDADNKEEQKKIDEEKAVQKGILHSLTSMPNMFKGLFGKKDDDEEGEEKEGFFSKILKFFTGEGVGIGKISLGSVLLKALPLALGAAAASGVFDNLFSKLTDHAFGDKDANDTVTTENENGEQVQLQLDENGNPVTDENGNYITKDGETISGDSKLNTNKSVANLSLSGRLKYNFVRNTAVAGKGSIIANTVKKTKVGKGVSSILKAATDAGAMDDVINGILDNTDTFIKALKRVPILKRFVNEEKLINLSVAIGDLIEKNVPKLSQSMGKINKLKGAIGKIALPLAIATAVMDFTTGWQDASTILKIKPEDVKTHHKIICGLVRTFKNLIPIVGTFIPDQMITDLFINHVANWFGIDVSEIKSKQEAAKKEMEEAGYDSWAEYNKIENQQYTWTEKLGNKVNSFFKNQKKNSSASVAASSPTMPHSYTGAPSTSPTTTTTSTTPTTYKPSYGLGSGLFGRGSEEEPHQIENPDFISQVDPRYKNKKFNIPGDSKVQTLGDSGCAPAAAAMAINSTIGGASMEDASKLALKYKVKDDGVRASYFDDEFSRHGLRADYSYSSSVMKKQLMNNQKVVLMGQDSSNTSKANSPFGPNPHYVTATGMSRDGKYVYINDPESSRPNIRYNAKKVLGSSKLGVAATAASGSKLVANRFRKYVARGTYGPETIQYKVWNALRAKGYNELATAAAMGNIQAESGFNPAVIEKGSGVGFGLAQWSYGRRTALEKAAGDQGVNPSSLEFQIKYLIQELEPNSGIWTKGSSKYNLGTLSRDDWANATDISKATKAFMCCFERPSYDPAKNHIDQRLQYAAQYYEAFTGMAIDTNLTFEDSYATSGGDSSSSSSSGGVGGVLGEIFGVFGKLADAFGFSSSNSSGYDSSVYPMHSGQAHLTYNDTVRSAEGNVSSNPEIAKKQKELVEKMYSIEGRLRYSQSQRDPNSGSGDCSSTVEWAYKNVLGGSPGGNTRDQRTNPNTVTVRSGSDAVKDESWLQLGDLLLKDGHVEMYAGDNKMIGHGGGADGNKLGPTEKSLNKKGAYDLVRRWAGFVNNESSESSTIAPSPDNPYIKNNETAMGSGLAYDNALHYISGRGSDTPPSIPLGINNTSNTQYNSNSVTSTMPAYSNNTTSKTNNISVSNNNMIELVQSIIKLLVQVVTNTDQLNNIVKLLGQYITAVGESNQTSSTNGNETAILAKQSFINAVQGSNTKNSNNAELQRLIERVESIAKC